ncbi:two-component system response regulator TcrA [Actinoplanes sichuanensis]|uniref:Response regulator transcription factor n=1 Tax=Actinoplanes sichuanensis TaxID=512349 RepID=A0ABW4A1G2_9ACTN|nr:response regulator transcription factor [Actinoplanes sichuanensis]BEL04093.1 two-component system response regulator TcrA [Actinoplanes sichuanensis]
MRILIAEDDPAMSAMLERAFRRAGYAVDTVGTGDDAVWAITETDFDAVVLDVMIPAPDGIEVCRRIRAADRWAPVLMLTARDGTDDKVRGLDAGADDYLTKPFVLDELMARVRALLRREPAQRPATLRVGDLELDPAARTVRRGGTAIPLSAKEFALLHELMRRAGETLSRTHLIEHVWDFAYDGGSNVVDVYVRYLRDKVDRPFGRTTIQTMRGAGYRLDPQA